MGGEHPEWLPLDWKVCVRVRSSGKKDKYYINPINGLKFNSKLEVLRYLKNVGKDLKLKELDKINIKKTLAEKLPSGWIKEIRINRKEGKTRRDPYYIDPVSGCHFRSMQEVFRYLDTKDSGKAEAKGDQDHSGDELEDHSKSSTAGAKGQRLIGKKADKIFTVNESIKSDVPEPKYVEQREIGNDSVAGDLPDKLAQVNGKKRHGGLSRNKRLADSKLKYNGIDNQSLQSGSEGVAVKNINLPETNALDQRKIEKTSVAEDRQHENIAHQNKRKKSNSKWMNLPRRTSKRLACVEADSSLEIKTSNQAREAARPSGEAEVNTFENIGKATLSVKPETNTSGNFGKSNEPNKHPTKCRTEILTKNKQKESTILPLGGLSSPEGHEGVGVDFKEDEKHEEHVESTLNDLFMDPCIEFAIKTLTGAIPIEDVNKVQESPVFSLASPNQTSGSSSVLPSGDIWADPCFEFAVKTLTSEIPMEDGSHFQISFQQPLSSSGASGCNSQTLLPKIRLDDSYTSSYSFSHSDAVMKPYAWQQGVRDPSLPHTMNGSSQNFVGTSLQHNIEGIKGKCL
ncbi:hypothetical protein Pfo_027781 [Paulownia fortunei]|nr:hypothetical protein Pfo_027781 [Paulownia fortunei]